MNINKVKKIKYCVSILLLSQLYACNSTKYSYYYLDDNKLIVTRIDLTKNGLKTYLIFGKTNSKDLPDEYLLVRYKPLLDGYKALLTHRNNKIILIQPYHYFEHFGPNKHFEIERMEDRAFYKIFFDSTQKTYTVIESID